MKFKLSDEAAFWVRFATVFCMVAVFIANIVPSAVPTTVKSEVTVTQPSAPASQPQYVGALTQTSAQPAESVPPAESRAEPAELPAEPSPAATSEAAEPSLPETHTSAQSAAGTAEPQITTAHTSAAESEPAEELININTAPLAELMQLSGIGEVKGSAIIAYREEHGAFSSVDELLNVKGIGEKTLDKIRARITV